MTRTDTFALARVRRAAAVVIENLEDRRLMAGDSTFVASLPFQLDFDAPRGGMADKNGNGTGFTWVMPNKLGTEYLPANIDLNTAQGILYLTTTGSAAAGGPWESDNTLTNSLQTQFNASTGSFTIRTRLVGPLGFIDQASEQGGIIFGPDQDNYVKLVAVAQPGGTFLQFIDEQKSGTSFTHSLSGSAALVNVGNFANVNTLDLEIVGDAATGKLQAFYRVNGGPLTKLVQEVTLAGSAKAAFFSSTARAGLIAMHKNDGGPITVGFDRFEILAGNPTTNRPSVTASRPTAGSTGVARDGFVAVDVRLPTPGAGVDAATLSSATVRLYRTGDRKLIEATVNTTGGGDAIVLQPKSTLEANTSYTFEINDGVKDTSGAAFVPFVMSFTTGSAATSADPRIAFEKVHLTVATGHKYSGLTMGPDGRLYAATSEGLIHRFDVKPDGTLGVPEVISTVQANNGGPRFITGVRFDPSSTATNLILWVSHNYSALENAQDWTGRISRLTGADLDVYEDYVVGLPRSVRDHLTNQIDFGPDGKLYFSQGSMTAMGAPDNAWGLRAEHLLAGAVLRLDTAAVAQRIAAGQGALDVKTEGPNAYNPFAAGAPLTLYATGVRNAYDLIWHSNGSLYAPTNGSAAGGATPSYGGGTYAGPRIDTAFNGPFASDPITGIGRVNQTENDYLHRVVDGGYYGHPNPTRGEFVQDGGNPTSGADYEEFTQYPVGTQPDRNYRGAAYVFGKNYSPNGVIEYKSDAFGGLLKGKLLVVRYSGGDDVVAMDVQGDGSVTGLQSGIAGLGGLVDPLDLTHDAASGNIYVSEYGATRITLLRPITPGARAEANKPTFYFNDVRGGAASPTQKVVVRNVGTGALSITGLTFGGADPGQFQIVSPPGLPHSVPVGGSVEIAVAFNPSSTTALGVKTAVLQVATNDPNRLTLNVNLRGLATAGVGGQLEPSLQRVFDLFDLPIRTGDTNPGNTNLFSNAEPLSSINDEIFMPRMVKAGSGPVTVETLAVFGVNSSPAVRFGYYQPGTPTAKTELFTVAKADAQSVNPAIAGKTSFDPGASAFGVYSSWPGFGNRDIYSEDALNTSEATVANRRKVRFYQLRNPDRSIVPNAYVMAHEEFVNATNGDYDNQDVVAIIRNVMPAAAGAEIGLENLDGVPFNDRMVFHRIQVQPPSPQVNKETGEVYQPPNNVVHDRGLLRVRNTGTEDLFVSRVEIVGNFRLGDNTPSTFTIPAGGSLDLEVVFTAQSGGVQEGSLKVFSNDLDEPAVSVTLSGVWQSHSEAHAGKVTEAPLTELIRAFGYTTTILRSGQTLDNFGKHEAVGDEVLSSYWQRSDPSLPVSVRQLAAFHRQGDTETIRTFLRSNTGSQSVLFTHNGLMGQSILPTLNGSLTAAAQANVGTSHVGSVFGFKVQSQHSDPRLNPQAAEGGGYGHYLRFFPAKDANGQVMKDTWLLAMDYYGINYDYQDNVYVITNMRPANPAAPTGVTAAPDDGGIRLDWNDNPEPTATAYNVYRGDSATGVFVKVNGLPVRASEFVDTGAPGGVTSYYKVAAADDWGGESAQSAVVSATRGADTAAPAAPTGLATVSRVDGVLLGWARSPEADVVGYRVYRALAADGSFAAINGGALVVANELLDSDTEEGPTYFYKVAAVDGSGNESPMSAHATGTRAAPQDVTPPAAPTSLTATGQKHGIVLNWAANGEADMAGYRVFRSTSATGTFAALNGGQVVLGTAFIDGTAATNQTYHYRITAVDVAGNQSAQSAVASASRLLPDPRRVNSAGGAFTDGQGRLWEADNGFSGGSITTTAYDVLGTTDDALYYTRRFGNFNYNLALPDGAYQLNLHFADPVHTVAGKRQFDVFAEGKQILDNFDVAANGGGRTAIARAFNVNVTGGELNVRFANVLDNAILSAIEIVPIGDTVAPAVPRRPTAAGGQDGIALDWQDNTEADLAGYNVYRSTSVEGTFVKVNAGSPLKASQFTDGTAPSAATSYYRITAVDVYGNESSPVSVSGTRPADVTPPAAPSGLAAVGSTSGVVLDWGDNAEGDLAGYFVYRQDAASGSYVRLNATPFTGSMFNDTAAAHDATSAYRVTAVDVAGNESAAVEAAAYRPPAPTAGTGLKAEYFDNRDFTNLKLTRTDAKVDFYWDAGSPDPSIGADSFSVRWTGQIRADATGTYTFTVRADDEVRLWVNGQLVVNQPNAGTAIVDNVSAPVQLVAGEKVDIRVEYAENTGRAGARLFWSSATMPKTVVPTANLFPAA